MLGKKSQVGETVTWLVATVAIVVILTISIFAASSLSKLNHRINIYDNKNLLLKNSLHSYLITKDADGNTTFQRIEESGKFDDFTASLGNAAFGSLDDKVSFDLRIREGAEVSYFNNLIQF